MTDQSNSGDLFLKLFAAVAERTSQLNQQYYDSSQATIEQLSNRNRILFECLYRLLDELLKSNQIAQDVNWILFNLE